MKNDFIIRGKEATLFVEAPPNVGYGSVEVKLDAADMDFYYVKKAHDTIPLDTPIAGCTGIVVEVTLGTPKDDHHFTDLCNDCRLKFLKMAVEHLERKVAAEKEGLNNDGEETDV